MTPERFQDLTEICGAEPRRWPEAPRKAAFAYMRDHAAEAEAALANASALDRMLGRHFVVPPSAALHELIVASAPKAARVTWQHARLWWQGAGFAGLGLAGALAGALIIGSFLPIDMQSDDDDGAYTITAFDDFPSRTEQ